MSQLITAEFESSHVTTFWNNKFRKTCGRFHKDFLKKLDCTHCNEKLLINIYPTNILLNKIGIAPNRIYTQSDLEDYIEHFFAKCPAERPLWIEVENLIAIWLGKRRT